MTPVASAVMALVGEAITVGLVLGILTYTRRALRHMLTAVQSIDERVDVLEARLDGKGPDRSENAIRLAVESAMQQGTVSQFAIGIHPTGNGVLTMPVTVGPADPRASSADPDYRLFTNPRTGRVIRVDLNQQVPGQIDGRDVGPLSLGKILSIIGETQFVDALFAHLEPAPPHVS